MGPKLEPLSSESFVAWRRRRGLSAVDAALRLGIGRASLYRWEAGALVPPVVRLAMAAIDAGLGPYEETAGEELADRP